MKNEERLSISITLSPAQVDDVVRAASPGRIPSIATLISNTLDSPPRAEEPAERAEEAAEEPPASASPREQANHRGYLPIDSVDPRMSRSLLRGLSVLTCFGPDGDARGIVELAGELGMSPSTAHRYAVTLVELGLLERCPDTRKYRLPGM